MPAKKFDTPEAMIAEIFRRLQERGIGTSQIAEALQVKPERVSEWRAGRHTPHQTTIEKLAALTGTRPVYSLARQKP